MEEKYSDLIDRYLRNEMSRDEKLDFEQQVLNNEQLRSELELTCRIKHRLADRQHKLRKTNEWERKSSKKYVYIGTLTSIAASLAIAFLVWPESPRLLQPSSVERTAMVSTSIQNEKQTIVHVEKATQKARADVKKGKDKEVIETVDELETNQLIPEISQISDVKLMSATVETQERDTILSNAYELYWMKIQSLLKIGKIAEAKTLLQKFSSIEGQYKVQADSLLNSLK